MVKKIILGTLMFVISTMVFAQQYEVPDGAVLIESTVMKDNGNPYLIEALYKLKDGSQMSVYYDAGGKNEIIVQKVLAAKTPAEQQQVLATQKPVFNISAANMQTVYQNMPGFIRYKFNDRYEMSQFMKIMKIQVYSGNRPSDIQNYFEDDQDHYDSFSGIYTVARKSAFLMYDKYDESWSLESAGGKSVDVKKIR